MQYRSALFTTALVSSALAAYVPSEPWTTLTPDASHPSGAVTDYASTFGIAVVPVTASSSGASASASPKAKRDAVSQIGDGQIQASTATPSSTKKAASTAQAVSQIGDGQIQASTSTAKPSSTAQAVSQIGDGQIQASTSTAKPSSTGQAISQISDGQVQASTSTKASVTASAASQIGDGQVQASSASASSALASASASQKADDSNPVSAVSCKSDGSLALTLKDSVLTDSAGRIGSIVANRQFQFDGPPPQAGAIYAAGWSITEDGYLALGDSDKFYQCLSGNFYNLYDENVADQCHEIKLEAVDLINC
ncbi:hypothetical protein WICANDRAFT_26623 [Wickerhamomyces anomalus NRRL Y-366-8]|uniref:Cell wall mannoprotein PIR1-like C-terminal domain-containing protein n=1 Tax=Wickerhamomyces anomalus (strain ATCC 58044 / CBS 1984 / NCYC 433 / NRRL Y-366-8) TaxID=683960 RepID=A0A1E3PCI3_WICAA|nr:uncharacterized protein WICANDRAFT_26623 [Wickerhamomyces anomalus NRRL Y-366-8]ODQ62924.1 hypothetical protein WICANDRAFT_26623 [Wickerhamomyces anomalus NRRL Y-366-8]